MSSAARVGGATERELFRALKDLENRFIENAAGLPSENQAARTWEGILFRIAETRLLAPLQDVAEVLDLPQDITRVPGTQGWVLGIANNRGTLLPIYDLGRFLLNAPTQRKAPARVLKVRRAEFPFGLLVNEVFGIRHMERSEWLDRMTAAEASVTPLLKGGFDVDGERMGVVDLNLLTEDRDFAKPAA